MDDLPEQDEDSGGAARAFEDLRAEMSVPRRAVEALPAAWTDNQPPDYSPDLARLNKGLASVATGLAAIEKHSALRLTPDQHEAAVARAGDALMRDASQKLNRATTATEREQRQLADMIGTMKEKTHTEVLADGAPRRRVCFCPFNFTDFLKYTALWLERRGGWNRDGRPIVATPFL